MSSFIVNMDICPFHVWQALQLDLQLLGNIMRISQRGGRIHDNVDFGNQSWARMVDSDRIDSFDRRRVSQANVGDELLSLDGSCNSDKKHKLAEGGVEPDGGDDAGENNGSHRVNPPLELRSTNRGEDTEAIDEKIISVVLPENVNLGVFIFESPAVNEQA